MDHLHRIALLPEKMTKVAVGSNFLAHSVPHPQQREGIVDHEIRMHLQRDLVNSVFASEFSRLLPVWNYFFLPLPVQHLAVLGWPAICDPVGHRVRGTAARTSGKTYD